MVGLRDSKVQSLPGLKGVGKERSSVRPARRENCTRRNLGYRLSWTANLRAQGRERTAGRSLRYSGSTVKDWKGGIEINYAAETVPRICCIGGPWNLLMADFRQVLVGVICPSTTFKLRTK